MLMLSNGLVMSFRELLDRIGYDVLITATEALPGTGLRVERASALAAELAALGEVRQVVPLRFAVVELSATPDGDGVEVGLIATPTAARGIWTIVEGRELFEAGDRPAIVVNRSAASELGLAPGATVVARCAESASAFPPRILHVAGVGEFPFDGAGERTAAAELAGLSELCGGTERDQADLLLVASDPRHGPEAAVAAIRGRRGDVHAFTNLDLVQRMQRSNFSYFRQISLVLSAITLLFAFLLIVTLLTVSINQRFGEIASLRALGFTRARVVLELVAESVLLVGAGGLVALPLGAALARWLDGILRAMPGIPARLHFFVFEPRALWLYLGLLGLTALTAAIYPAYLAFRLPIAATLRRETAS
jgi:putative ABC transport system permease protein